MTFLTFGTLIPKRRSVTFMLVPVLQSCHSCINGFTFWFLIRSLGVPQRDLPGALVEMHSQQRAGAQDGGLAIRLYHSLVVQRTSKVESAIKTQEKLGIWWSWLWGQNMYRVRFSGGLSLRRWIEIFFIFDFSWRFFFAKLLLNMLRYDVFERDLSRCSAFWCGLLTPTSHVKMRGFCANDDIAGVNRRTMTHPQVKLLETMLSWYLLIRLVSQRRHVWRVLLKRLCGVTRSLHWDIAEKSGNKLCTFFHVATLALY